MLGIARVLQEVLVPLFHQLLLLAQVGGGHQWNLGFWGQGVKSWVGSVET